MECREYVHAKAAVEAKFKDPKTPLTSTPMIRMVYEIVRTIAEEKRAAAMGLPTD